MYDQPLSIGPSTRVAPVVHRTSCLSWGRQLFIILAAVLIGRNTYVARPSVRLFVPYRLLTRKQKDAETIIGANVPQGVCNRYANFQLKRSKVRVMVRVRVAHRFRRTAAPYVGTGPTDQGTTGQAATYIHFSIGARSVVSPTFSSVNTFYCQFFQLFFGYLVGQKTFSSPTMDSASGHRWGCPEPPVISSRSPRCAHFRT